jgi:hypothetical protein
VSTVTETHVAGLDLEVQGRYLIQRCAWCGGVLLAYDYLRTATPGEWEKPGTWPHGALIRCTYDGTITSRNDVALSRTMQTIVDSDRLPDDACALTMPLETQ